MTASDEIKQAKQLRQEAERLHHALVSRWMHGESRLYRIVTKAKKRWERRKANERSTKDRSLIVARAQLRDRAPRIAQTE